MLTILIRTLIMYASLIFTMRFMGKRQLGELEISELITTVLLSELASLPITNPDVPLSYAVLPILILMSLEVLLSALQLKFPALKHIFAIRPAILIRHGKPDAAAMRSIRISADELMSQLRLKDVTDFHDVEYAILESNGQISVVTRASERQPTTSELNIHPAETGMMHLIIADGKINRRNLSLAGKDEAWLASFLSAHKTDAREVFILTVDDTGKTRLVTRRAAS